MAIFDGMTPLTLGLVPLEASKTSKIKRKQKGEKRKKRDGLRGMKLQAVPSYIVQALGNNA